MSWHHSQRPGCMAAVQHTVSKAAHGFKLHVNKGIERECLSQDAQPGVLITSILPSVQHQGRRSDIRLQTSHHLCSRSMRCSQGQAQLQGHGTKTSASAAVTHPSQLGRRVSMVSKPSPRAKDTASCS